MIKELVQHPLIKPTTDLVGKGLQWYFANSNSNASLRHREQVWENLFPFLSKDVRSLSDPELRSRFEFVRANLQEGNILDVGYYDGLIARELSSIGHEVTAIDHIHRQSIANGYDNGMYITAYAERLPFQDEKFSNVVMSHSLEHILNPVLALTEARRVLVSGGRIIVIVPRIKGNKPTHIRKFNKETLIGTINAHFDMESYHPNVGFGHGYVGIKSDRT